MRISPVEPTVARQAAEARGKDIEARLARKAADLRALRDKELNLIALILRISRAIARSARSGPAGGVMLVSSDLIADLSLALGALDKVRARDRAT